jgi:Short C-terminal domain
LIRRRRQAKQAAKQQQQDAQQQQAAQPVAQPPAQPPAQATGLTDNDLAQLKQLGKLHESGVLTDSEFEAAKQKILGKI